MSIGQWIKEARRVAGLTQTELGEKLGRTKGNVSAWEKDAHEPSFTQILEIAKLINWAPPPPGLEPLFRTRSGATPIATQKQQKPWPFPSIDEAGVQALSPRQIGRLEGAIALTVAQLKLPVKVEPLRQSTSGNVVDMDGASDEFAPLANTALAPWEGGKTTKQMENTAGGVLISQAVDVGHVPDSGYSANDHEFIPIPELDVRLAAGTLGIENYQETEIGQILLRRSFLESFGLPIDRMRIVYSDGDSMEPAIRNRNPMLLYIERIQDMLQINRRIVYAINQGGSMLVKCISRTRDGIWLAKSLNPAYKPIPLTRDDGRDVNIVGRILWSPNDLRNGVDERLLRS